MTDPTIHELLDRLEEKVDLILAALLGLQASKADAGTESPETWPEIGIRLARQARLKRNNHYQNQMRRR